MAEPVDSNRLSAPTVLLTGFEAFGGETVNPSWLAAQALHGRQILGHRIVASCLPTAFGASVERLHKLMVMHQPVLVLCVGQAGGRANISLERVAINVDDARIPDNLGAQPVDAPVVAGGPAAYFSSLPIKSMLVALRREQLPVELSQTAGTFVCNHVFYSLMHALATQCGLARVRGGFVHVPYLPTQVRAAGTPSLPLQDLVRGLHVMLEAALSTDVDAAVSAGSLH